MITFRDATIEDLPAIVAIYNSTVAGRMVTADTEEVTVGSRQKWFDDHSPHLRPLWMVEEHGILLGWCSFQSFYGRPAYQGTAEISIYIAPEQRGRGIGNTILRHAMESCASLHIKTLLGFVFSHNLPSMRLFTKNAFEIWAHLPRVAQLDAQERDLIILGKRINA